MDVARKLQRLEVEAIMLAKVCTPPCGPVYPYSGRDCVKSLRSSYTGSYPQTPFSLSREQRDLGKCKTVTAILALAFRQVWGVLHETSLKHP